MKISKKLSVKNCFGDVKKIRACAETGNGSPVPILRVAGVANKLEKGMSDNGEWTAFKGSFEVTNLENGEIFVGGRLFIPSPIQDMLEAKLEADTAIEFAFDVTVQESENVIGYEYGAETILEPDENDPLVQLRNRLNETKPLQIAKK